MPLTAVCAAEATALSHRRRPPVRHRLIPDLPLPGVVHVRHTNPHRWQRDQLRVDSTCTTSLSTSSTTTESTQLNRRCRRTLIVSGANRSHLSLGARHTEFSDAPGRARRLARSPHHPTITCRASSLRRGQGGRRAPVGLNSRRSSDWRRRGRKMWLRDRARWTRPAPIMRIREADHGSH